MTNDPSTCDLDALAIAKFQDMADQLEYLYSQGKVEEAQLLKQEGFDLAAELDSGSTFVYLNDLSSSLWNLSSSV